MMVFENFFCARTYAYKSFLFHKIYLWVMKLPRFELMIVLGTQIFITTLQTLVIFIEVTNAYANDM